MQATQEYEYYMDNIMTKEMINHTVKRGPYMVAILKNNNIKVNIKEKKANYVTINNGQSKVQWQMDKYISNEWNRMIDGYRENESMLFEVLLKCYTDQTIPKVPTFT